MDPTKEFTFGRSNGCDGGSGVTSHFDNGGSTGSASSKQSRGSIPDRARSRGRGCARDASAGSRGGSGGRGRGNRRKGEKSDYRGRIQRAGDCHKSSGTPRHQVAGVGGGAAGETSHTCPVCSQNVTATLMNEHLDKCLRGEDTSSTIVRTAGDGPSPSSAPSTKRSSRSRQRRRGAPQGPPPDAIDAAYSPGARKGVSISHLLDFGGGDRRVEVGGLGRHYASPRARSSINPTRPPKKSTGGSSSAYSRDRFIHANCQFRVAAAWDYDRVLGDADAVVAWENIREILVTSTESPRCPICLGAPPAAAKITRCGHVFCWHCILHHVACSSDAWQSCPLCDDFVYGRDLRSVQWKVVPQPTVGAYVRLRMLKRLRGSTLPVVVEDWPRAQQHKQESTTGAASMLGINMEALLHDPAINKEFFKIVPITLEGMKHVHSRERAELLQERLEGGPDRYIEQALQSLPGASVGGGASGPPSSSSGGGRRNCGSDVAEGRGDAWVGVSDTDDVAWREIVPGLRVRTRSTSSQSSLSSASSADDTTAANFPPLASPPSRQRPHVAVVKAPVPGDTSVTDNMHALDNMHAPDNIRAPDNMHTTDAAWEDIQGSSWGARRETGSSLSSWGSAGASPTGSILAYPGHTTAFAGSVASPHNVTVGFDVVPPPPVFGTANGAFESTAPRSNSSAPEGDAVMSLGAEAGGKVHVREPSRGKGCHAGSSDGVYTFYQSVDAQPVFLHSLNMRCLLHEYGNGNTDDAVDVCPAEVGGEVVEVLRHTMTDELRRRFRYLAHLPVGCEFFLVELDLRQCLSAATMAHFAKDFEARKTARRRRAADEKRHERQAAKRRLRLEQEEERATRASLASRCHDNTTDYDARSLVQFPSTSAATRTSSADAGDPTDTVPPTRPAGAAGYGTTHPRGRFATAAGGIMADEHENPPLSAVRVETGKASRQMANSNTTVGAWGLARPVSDGVSSYSGAERNVAQRGEYEPPSHQESFQQDLEGIINTIAGSPTIGDTPAAPDTNVSQNGSKKKKKNTKKLLLSFA
eukprot:m.555022 g.555022  ORF g.555022 m.555022 type:complete len:1039 (+) comp22179_c1_seq5:75-3191(+)